MLTSQRKIFAIRFIALVTALILLVAALGLYQNYEVLRTGIAFGFFLLAGLFFLTQYTKIAGWTLLLGILFSPWLVSLPQQMWVIVDVLSIIWLLYIARKTTNPYEKGARFEEYITTIFKEPAFVIKDRTRDTSKFMDRYVESDMHPDFVFRNQKTGKLFAVECKWRSNWYTSKSGELGLYWEIVSGNRYLAYEKEYQIPVYVALGIGGTPEKPKEVYFLEAKDLIYPFLKQSFVQAGKTAPQMVAMG